MVDAIEYRALRYWTGMDRALGYGALRCMASKIMGWEGQGSRVWGSKV